MRIDKDVKPAARPYHQRKSIRLAGYDYSIAGGYFVTVVSHERIPIFGEIVDSQVILSVMGEIVSDCWNEIPVHFPNTSVDEFIIMLNHVHGIILIH